MGEDDRRRDERGAPAHDAHPQGGGSHSQKVSGAPGFWIGNVIVMAGVPSIMQAMLDEASTKLETGVGMLSETVRADACGGDVGTQLGEIAKANLRKYNPEPCSALDPVSVCQNATIGPPETVPGQWGWLRRLTH
jgi:molybdopterin-biosynthesis enzyme MoeA-like protein